MSGRADEFEARFEVEERIGAGAFGEVFRGRDRTTSLPVAIKRLREHTRDAVASERFALEARLLARIRNPYVVRYVTEGFDREGRACLVLEWLDGEDLAHRRKRKPLSIHETVEFVRQAALGLDALHREGIVHRDVKPSNFFVVEEEGTSRIRLIDLGIARVAFTASALTMEGTRIGTPAYMSPEQARGDGDIDARSDLFSLGIMLFELVAGRRPFEGHDPFAILAKIVLQEAPHLADVVPGVPPDISAIVQRALARDRGERFRDALEFAAALQSAHLDGSFIAQAEAASDSDTAVVGPATDVASIEQRLVTALFASFAPGRHETQLHSFRGLAAEHGATIYPLLGGRAVALFGLERSRGDEAVRAAHCALRASREIERVRLAIASSRVLAGGDGLSADGIDRGIEQMDRVTRGIRVDEATGHLLAERFEIVAQEGASLLIGERSTDEDAPPRLLGKTIPILGRDRELAMSEACARECFDEPAARIALVLGNAGIGKTRVRQAFVDKLRTMDEAPRILLGRGSSFGAGSPLALLASALRHAFGIGDADEPALAQSVLRARVDETVAPEQAARITAFLGELLRIPFPESEHPPLANARRDPMQMGDSMRLAFQDWLDAITQKGPAVFVLEDLQWGDAATLDYLFAALNVLRERPILVLGIGRSEVRDTFPALASRSDVQEIRVGPLGKKAAQKMVALALGDGVPADRVDAWIERVDGNAFHLEELLRAVHAGRGDALPESVLGMVQSRLDALSPGARRALRVGSVYGQTFWRGSVRALVGDEHANEIGPWLDELVQREVVSRKSASAIAGEEEFTIRGTLLHDAAYATVPDSDRSRAHELAGLWLEASGFRNAATLAEHFERGEDAARAYRWLRRAAEESMEANDYPAAIARAERAMRYTSAPNERGELRVLQAEANRWRGRLDECGRCAADAMQLLPEGSPRWFRALGEAGVVAGRTGQMDHAVDLAKRWFDAEERSGPSIDAISAATRLAVQLLLGGRLEAGHALADAIENSVTAFPDIGPLGEGRVAQCRAKRALLTRDLEGYLRHSQRAVESFERGGDERNAAVERLNAAHAMLQLGLYPESEATVKQVLGTVGRLGMVSMGMGARHHLARSIAHRGEFAQARAYETEVVAWFAKQGDPRMTGMCTAVFAEILLDAGDRTEALATAKRAVEIAEPVPAALARALGALALTQLGAGDATSARETAARGVSLVERIGSIEEGEGQLRYSQSAALLALGDRDGARAAIEIARKVLLANAERVATTEYRERFLRDIPVHAKILALAEELNPA